MTTGIRKTLQGMSNYELFETAFEYLNGNDDYFEFACELMKRIPVNQEEWTKEHCSMFNRSICEFEGLLFVGYLETVHPEIVNNGKFNFSTIY